MSNEYLEDSTTYKQNSVEDEPTINELLALEKEMQSEGFLKNSNSLNYLSQLDTTNESNEDIDESDEGLDTEFSEEDSELGARFDSIRIYLDGIGKYPLLDANDEVELAKKIQTGDEDARQLLINSNLRLVVNIAGRYLSTYFQFGSIQLLDLIQEGNLGLMKAADRYDYTIGCRFSTYAYWWIRQFIVRGIQNNYSNIRIPAYINDQLRLIQKVREELNLVDLEDNKTLETLSDFINSHSEYRNSRIPKITPNIIKTYEMLRANTTTISLSNPISPEDDRTMEELVEADPSSRPDFIAEDNLQLEYLNEVLEKVLDPKCALLIKLRYGLDKSRKSMSLEEIGNIMGVSRERIRQVEDKSLKKLKLYFLKLHKKNKIPLKELLG